MDNLLRIAVQKKGRLNDRSLKLIRDCGIDYTVSNGQLKARADNFPLEILLLRDDDIPGYVADGVADLGIVGRNEVEERRKPVDIIKDLGFSRCKLSIAIPRDRPYQKISDLNHLNIATSYPNILTDFLLKTGVRASIHHISGSVEIAPAIGLTDAICDLISSGSTLLNNGLREVETVFLSSAVLITRKDLRSTKLNILDKLMLRINAVIKAEKFKYILLNAPEQAIENIRLILPGMKSPTISPLSEPGWKSVQSVVREDEFWEIVEKLNKLGAQGILVMPIEKMVY